MRILSTVRTTLAAMFGRADASGETLTCGDCARSERCGMPPHDDCLEKVMARSDPDFAPPSHEPPPPAWPS